MRSDVIHPLSQPGGILSIAVLMLLKGLISATWMSDASKKYVKRSSHDYKTIIYDDHCNQVSM